MPEVRRDVIRQSGAVTVIPHVKSRESDFCDNDGVCLRKWKEELEAVAKIPGATPKAMVAGRCRYCLRGLIR